MKSVLKILITAGGTIVKIDDVRHIGNFSTGSFPSKIADVALSKGHEVFYLYAKTAKVPKTAGNLKLIVYETYDDYSRELKRILSNNKIDIVFLGAAVSDYGLKPYRGKFSSSRKKLTIHLFPLPKIIKFVKKWSKTPLFQVGFKLMSNISDENLIETGYKAGLDNRSDLTIANDLVKIKAGKREVTIITSEKGAIKFSEPNLAKKIFDFVEKRARVTHFKTFLVINKSISQKYKKEINLFSKLCALLYRRKLMPEFFSGAKSSHGSLSLRVKGNSFLITARGSNKKNLQPSDVILVEKVDWRKRKIFVQSIDGKKASLNAILSAAIFREFPEVKAMVHTHSFAAKVPMTSFPQTPGTLEYVVEPIRLFKKNHIINLKNHGLIAVGSDLKEVVNNVVG